MHCRHDTGCGVEAEDGWESFAGLGKAWVAAKHCVEGLVIECRLGRDAAELPLALERGSGYSGDRRGDHW